MSLRMTKLWVCACACLCAVGELRAQRPETRCKGIIAALDGSSNTPRYRAALERIHECPDKAAGRITTAWSHDVQDSAHLAALKTAAVRFRDQRVAEQLLTVMGSERFGRPMRLSALEALATYYRRCLVVHLVVQDLGKYGKEVAVLAGTVPGDDAVTGSRPPSAGIATQVIAAMDALAIQPGDTVVKVAARRLAIALKQWGLQTSRC